MSSLKKISVTVLTKNSEKHLKEVLDALEGFDEALVYDNGSQDKTLEIAKSYPFVRLEEGKFFGFGETHNVASELAKNDWVLSIDSDEVLTPELKEEIGKLHLDPKRVYRLDRDNYYRGQKIKGCGWSPDAVYRLYHRKTTRFSEAKVHESLITEGLQVIKLKNPLVHYSYDSIFEFLAKMQNYSELFALERRGKVKSSPLKALGRGWFAFFKSYILKKGIFDGYPGLLISAYNGHTAFYKYLKLYEMNLDLEV